MVNNNMVNNNNDNVFTITIVRDETGDQCDHSNITQLTVTPDNGRVGNCQWLSIFLQPVLFIVIVTWQRTLVIKC